MAATKVDPGGFTLAGADFRCVAELPSSGSVMLLELVVPDAVAIEADEQVARAYVATVVDLLSVLVVDRDALHAHLLVLAPTVSLDELLGLLADAFTDAVAHFTPTLDDIGAASPLPDLRSATELAEDGVTFPYFGEPTTLDGVIDTVLRGAGELGGRG